ncbi:MAG: HAMP domain-containing histidine kinase [Oscillospiraceae bacterium]|nr:HAMP domain-containing histidine kinase [Oscillospiraceae bacterium]
MASNIRYSRAVQILSVVLSIIFLWGFGISLLIVILNIGIGFPVNNVDFRQAFLDMTQRDKEQDVLNYLQLTLRADMPDPAEREKVFISAGSYGIEMNLHSYEQRFDPANTNYRFAATDTDGNLLLTNDPDYGSDLPVLASAVYTRSIYLKQRDYQEQKHFDDPVNAYQEITYGNVARYLADPSEYKLWYFSDNRVDNAYHNGLEVKSYEDPYTDYMFFESAGEANKFDYKKVYGDLCKWKIVAASAAGFQADGQGTAPKPDDSSIVVEISAYKTQNQFLTTLESYYNMKDGGLLVRAVDEDLEKLLTTALDITIRGEHAETQNCYIRSYLYENMQADDTIRANYAIFSLLFRHSEWSVVLMFVLLVLTVLACIAMCTAAGHTAGDETVTVSPVHRIAYECFWLLPPAMLFASWLLMRTLFDVRSPYRTIAIFCIGMIFCIAACSILWLYTTAIRMKTSCFWQDFGLFRILRFLLNLFRNRTLAVILFVVLSAALFCLNVFTLLNAPAFIPLTLCIDLLALLFMIYSIYAYFELHRHVRQMETGDFTPAQHPVKLFSDFGSFDASLNEITGKVAEIVAQQTKAEHLRTELITNVSHDLKTPLTSIVNYVDLLSREQMPNETAAEYLDVLRRQAARLQKLTIDLVDASKASTGNLTVELLPTDLQVLLSQLAGEYEELMESKELTLKVSAPEEPLTILADGRQIWRVFDNLLNNACKYALSGTRVYLDVKKQDDQAVISLKNISAQPLNVSPDELMERFVRGDASRHTEGSGLGLSIARDLTVLQNGTMRLSTDGDLFKVYLTFPLCPPPADAPEPAE